jgi:uncharacterized membrane protein
MGYVHEYMGWRMIFGLAQERYARGEIPGEEFEQIKKDLSYNK